MIPSNDPTALEKLAIYVVYDHPRDFPDVYVVRVWHGERPDMEPLATSPDYAVIEAVLEGMGLVKFQRYADDDPAIKEWWI